nr:MAG TPA_asm: hypothetical protein [Caudoviricetes sp.]
MCGRYITNTSCIKCDSGTIQIKAITSSALNT